MFKNILFAIWVIGTILLAVYGQYLAAAFSLVVGLQIFTLALITVTLMGVGITLAGAMAKDKNFKKNAVDVIDKEIGNE